MFDINKPHKRRDGGEFEIVTINDGVAFGYYFEKNRKKPTWWRVEQEHLVFSGTGILRKLDIIQLPEEKEVVGWINVWEKYIGGSCTSKDAADSIAGKGCAGLVKTTAKLIDGKLVSVKSEIVE